ncbi:MAG: DUF1428 domain-containing protein [Geminicoccaceae bacterium]
MSYVDGFLLAVPSDKRERYREYAAFAAEIFCECGALRLVECWGDDVPRGKVTDMFMAVKATAEETVCFAWVEWPSKEARDAGMAKVMADPRLEKMGEMPFDGQRMIFGGFQTIIDVTG